MLNFDCIGRDMHSSDKSMHYVMSKRNIIEGKVHLIVESIYLNNSVYKVLQWSQKAASPLVLECYVVGNSFFFFFGTIQR
jgi:hypothetical protein